MLFLYIPALTNTIFHRHDWLRQSSESVGRSTHHVRLVHLDGHFTDGVGCFVDHFQEAGAAQGLRAHCSGQLDTHTHNVSQECTKLGIQ